MLLAFDTSSPTVTVALHDGTDVVSEHTSERQMKHGEQLAPLIETALLAAGLVRQDLTAIGVGVGPGPFTGLRVGLVTARTLGYVLELPVYGVCSLDVLAVEAAATGIVDAEFAVATDARRKEVYFATYDGDGRRLTDPVVDKPAALATDGAVVGEGPSLYPDAFPHAVGSAPPQRGLAGSYRRRGAGRAARPRAALPAPPRRRGGPRPEAGLVIRDATAADAEAIYRLEAECLGPDAWSRALVESGVCGEVPTVHYLVVEDDGEVTAYAAASLVADIAELQRIAVLPASRRRGHATALLEAVVERAVAGQADRLLLEVREANADALAFYAASGFVEVDRRPRYYRDGSTAIVLRRPIAGGCG